MIETSMPFGVRDFTPNEIQDRDQFLAPIQEQFELSGYQRVQTPSFEFFDAIKDGLVNTWPSAAFSFLIPLDGP